jgi:hypothetical protein
VVNLHKVIETYVGRVWARKLKINSTQRKKIEDDLPTIWGKIKDLPYDATIWDLMRTEFRLDWGNMNRMDKFFCSALVTFLLEKFGYVKVPVDWDLILPKDYDSKGKMELLLIEDVKLGAVIQLL